MGLPIWREPSETEAATKTDPTAAARSAIRRTDHTRRTQPPARFQRTDSSAPHPHFAPQPSLQENRHDSGRTIAPIEILRRRQRRNETSARLGTTVHYARPRSRRGPPDETEIMPPLRRMGHRDISERQTRSLPWTDDAAPAPPEINGLGDRERSFSPPSESDVWAVMGSTITPDPSLPSASTSFDSVGSGLAASSTVRGAPPSDPVEWDGAQQPQATAGATQSGMLTPSDDLPGATDWSGADPCDGFSQYGSDDYQSPGSDDDDGSVWELSRNDSSNTPLNSLSTTAALRGRLQDMCLDIEAQLSRFAHGLRRSRVLELELASGTGRDGVEESVAGETENDTRVRLRAQIDGLNAMRLTLSALGEAQTQWHARLLRQAAERDDTRSSQRTIAPATTTNMVE